MGYRLNRLDEPVFMAGPKPLRTEFGIHLRLESCERFKAYLDPQLEAKFPFQCTLVTLE